MKSVKIGACAVIGIALFSLLSGNLPASDSHPSANRLEISALADAPLLTETDFKHANVTGEGSQSLVMVELNPAAAARFHTYTAAHVDGRLAVLIEGQPVHAPRIRTQMGDRFQVGPFEHAEAVRLAALINDAGTP